MKKQLDGRPRSPSTTWTVSTLLKKARTSVT
jgi:hypothetical protein